MIRNSKRNQSGGACGSCMIGGQGHQGHTVIDSVYHGRPEYNLYNATEMTAMGAKVENMTGGNSVRVNSRRNRNQLGGEGHQGHTVIDSAYHGRPEYNLYNATEMAAMGAKVETMSGGTYQMEDYVEVEQNEQKGGFAKEAEQEHKERIQGIIENMINVSDSSDKDIISILQNEIEPKSNRRYGYTNAKKILKEYYVFNSSRTTRNENGRRKFPSDLLDEFINENKQKGGNRVVLPLSFFTGEIPK